jgi:hypothetical protein
MGNRRVARTKMVLPVRVSGTDGAGKPFSYLAHTLDITLKGARLGGVRSLLALGDAVEVQCRHRKARFRVAWIGRPGHSSEHQIGIEALEPDKPIWGLDLVDREVPDEFVPSAAAEAGRRERRGRNRVPVAGNIEIRHSEDAPTMRADVTDVSTNGCYVHCDEPLRVSSELRVSLRIDSAEIDALAVVRTCHPKVGMGIEFVEFRTSADAQRYTAALERLALTSDGGPPAAAPPKPDAISVGRRLEHASRELDDIGELLKSVEVDPLVLREFRGALSHVRATAWAVQRWIEIHSRRADPFPVLAYINVERLHLATNVCRSLCVDMQNVDANLPKKELEELLHAVEELFSALWVMDFNEKGVEGEKPLPRPRAAASAHPAESD